MQNNTKISCMNDERGHLSTCQLLLRVLRMACFIKFEIFATFSVARWFIFIFTVFGQGKTLSKSSLVALLYFCPNSIHAWQTSIIPFPWSIVNGLKSIETKFAAADLILSFIVALIEIRPFMVLELLPFSSSLWDLCRKSTLVFPPPFEL